MSFLDQDFLPPDDPTRGGINGLGAGLHSHRQRAMDLPVELVVAASAHLEKQGGNVRDAIREVHTPKVYPFTVRATKKVLTHKNRVGTKIPGMTKKWIQSPTFADHLKAYQDATGETHAQIAVKLGVSEPYLRNILYNSKAPGIKFKTRAAQLFKADLDDYLDNPGAKRKSTGKDLSVFSEITRHQFDRLVVSLGDKKLDQDDLDILFEDFQREIQKTLNMKDRQNK